MTSDEHGFELDDEDRMVHWTTSGRDLQQTAVLAGFRPGSRLSCSRLAALQKINNLVADCCRFATEWKNAEIAADCNIAQIATPCSGLLHIVELHIRNDQ